MPPSDIVVRQIRLRLNGVQRILDGNPDKAMLGRLAGEIDILRVNYVRLGRFALDNGRLLQEIDIEQNRIRNMQTSRINSPHTRETRGHRGSIKRN